MNIGTQVTFTTDSGVKSGVIVWISEEFAWIDLGFGNVQKVSLTEVQI